MSPGIQRDSAARSAEVGAVPDVSVVVIAHNEAAGIEDCLRALLSQKTTLSYEIVVIDDGSTDTTGSIVKRLEETEDRIRLVSLGTNRGRGAARLAGQQESTGPRVAFVDADILVPSHWIATCAAELNGKSAVSGVARPDGDCAVIWRIFQPGIRVRSQPSAITGNNVMFDASALQLEGFDELSRLGEDTRLADRMIKRGLRLETIPDLVSEHLEHKTYWMGVRWMFENGVDATRLPLELRRVRTPDLTWLGWILSGLGLLIGGLLGKISAALAVVLWAGVTGLINIAYMISRFTVRPRPFRWIAATAANLPLMTAYLCGRTVGLGRLGGAMRASRDAADG